MSSEVTSMLSICFYGVLLGLIPAAIAHNKGHNFLGWWIFGAGLFIVALPLAIVLKPDATVLEKRKELASLAAGGRKCPSCAEVIKREARVCRFCGRDVEPERVSVT